MKPLPTLAAVAALAGCTGPASPYPPGWLSYGFPSPPHAVYEITDTVAGIAKSPVGDLEIAGEYEMSLDLSFERAPEGMRVRGIANGFEGTLSDPVQATGADDLEYLAGTLEFLMNRRGVVEVESFPELSGVDAEVFSFAELAYDLFPRLPDTVVEPGGTWLDTLRWHTDGEVTEVISRTVYDYTLVGDTVVDGRGLLHIAATGRVEFRIYTGRAGNLTRQSMKGSSTGVILWDPETRLVTSHEYQRDLEGTVSRRNRAPFGLRLTEVVRIRQGL